jgi:hypothetical protein
MDKFMEFCWKPIFWVPFDVPLHISTRSSILPNHDSGQVEMVHNHTVFQIL